MKYTLAWLAAEGITLLLTVGMFSMAIGALLNALEIGSVFSLWFDSAYVPGLLALCLWFLRLGSKLAVSYFLHQDDDEPTGSV